MKFIFYKYSVIQSLIFWQVIVKEIYIFNTNEPRDIQYLSNLLGSAITEKIQSLRQHEYVLWQDGIDGYTTGTA